LLDWHRREDQAGWWEYFRLLDLAEEDLFDEPQAIAGLEFIDRVDLILSRKGKPTGSVIDRYRYPIQEMEIRRGDELKLKSDEKLGEVFRVARAQHTIDIRKGPKMAGVHPTAVFEHRYVNVEVIEDAIYAIGESVVRGDADRLAVRLLTAEAPSTMSGSFESRPGETAVDFAVRLGGDLAETILAIQDPPGAGKTFTGAQMIWALVAQGKRIGVTATGHSVIRNLLDAVSQVTARLGRNDVTLGHKLEAADDNSGNVTEFDDNKAALDALQSGEITVLGGTAWLWSRPEFAKSVDVLFVDEAGQMSLANVLAMTPAARNVVLLGDPQQLEQPKKGTHPDGVGLSALQHMLGTHTTIPRAAESFFRRRGGCRQAFLRSRLRCFTRVGFVQSPDSNGNYLSEVPSPAAPCGRLTRITMAIETPPMRRWTQSIDLLRRCSRPARSGLTNLERTGRSQVEIFWSWPHSMLTSGASRNGSSREELPSEPLTSSKDKRHLSSSTRWRPLLPRTLPEGSSFCIASTG
jgi:hypothetical protein